MNALTLILCSVVVALFFVIGWIRFRPKKQAETTLAPCGCGGKAVSKLHECLPSLGGEPYYTEVYCGKCYIRISGPFYKDYTMAVSEASKRWNTAMGKRGC